MSRQLVFNRTFVLRVVYIVVSRYKCVMGRCLLTVNFTQIMHIVSSAIEVGRYLAHCHHGPSVLTKMDQAIQAGETEHRRARKRTAFALKSKQK